MSFTKMSVLFNEVKNTGENMMDNGHKYHVIYVFCHLRCHEIIAVGHLIPIQVDLQSYSHGEKYLS